MAGYGGTFKYGYYSQVKTALNLGISGLNVQGIQRNKASNLVCVCLVNNDRLQIFLFEESTEKDVGVDSKRGRHRLEKVRGFFDQSGESSKPKLLSNLPIMTVTDP